MEFKRKYSDEIKSNMKDKRISKIPVRQNSTISANSTSNSSYKQRVLLKNINPSSPKKANLVSPAIKNKKKNLSLECNDDDDPLKTISNSNDLSDISRDLLIEHKTEEDDVNSDSLSPRAPIASADDDKLNQTAEDDPFITDNRPSCPSGTEESGESEIKEIIIYEKIIHTKRTVKENENVEIRSDQSEPGGLDLSHETNDADNEWMESKIRGNYLDTQQLRANELEDNIIIEAPEEFRTAVTDTESPNKSESTTSAHRPIDIVSSQVPPKPEEDNGPSLTRQANHNVGNKVSPEAEDTTDRTPKKDAIIDARETVPEPPSVNNAEVNEAALESCRTLESCFVDGHLNFHDVNNDEIGLEREVPHNSVNSTGHSLNSTKFVSDDLEVIATEGSDVLCDSALQKHVNNSVKFLQHVGSTSTTPTSDLISDISCSNMQLDRVCLSGYDGNEVMHSSERSPSDMDAVCPKAPTSHNNQEERDPGSGVNWTVSVSAGRDRPDSSAGEGKTIAEFGRESQRAEALLENKCAGHESLDPSIAASVPECADSGGCSLSAASKPCASPTPRNTSNSHTDAVKCNADTSENSAPDCSDAKCAGRRDQDQVNSASSHLVWKFENGRLVFETVESKSGRANESEKVPHSNQINQSSDNSEFNSLESANNILYSKDLNKRVDENKSRLKHLEEKLKQAGITDDTTKSNANSQSDFSYDSNHNNIVKEQTKTELSEENLKLFKDGITSFNDEEYLPSEDSVDFCQFDPRHIQSLADFSGYVEVYDEFDSDSEENYIIMRETSNNMGTESDRIKHNPDKDNLKSLLKKPGRIKDRKNRVIFNENKNEFFDADYIILIREECDFDEDDDDSICTCNQHEMVRLQCCEPNCNCMYDGYDQTPQSPKFAPPIEFVDAVTLSPPEGYKDMELGEQQLLALQQMARRGQRAPVCRECRECSHEDEDDDEGEGSQSDTELGCRGETEQSARGEYNERKTDEEEEEKEKTDQSQQTTPTTPPNDADCPKGQRNYILETISMTTVTEQRMLREVQQEEAPAPPGGSPISGILKGGRLWKQQSMDASSAAGNAKTTETQQIPDSDDETSNKRSVRFIESESDKRDSCDGASDNPQETEEDVDEVDAKLEKSKNELKPAENISNSTSPESTEMTLTFKLGNHVLISNNSLKPNSAVRQLFPCTKPSAIKGQNDDEAIHQYLVTAESLRAFEEAKRSKLPQMIQSGETDESIKRAIERNTLRRSLIRYEPKSRKNIQKTDNSLVERIKQLTCDVDDMNQEEIAARVSPPGEEARNSPEVNSIIKANHDKSFSPSSSSTTSSNSSSMSSTYKKITDLFGKRDKLPDVQNNFGSVTTGLPDLGGPNQEVSDGSHSLIMKNNPMNESRRQFLSTLAPLTACVSAIGNTEEYYYHMSNQVGERASMASSIGTEYSLEDIDEGLKNGEDDGKRIAPDVLVGTPSASESGDELAMFVQQDASRIERIKKKYQPEEKKNADDDDEHDDYGFNRRPSVRGIKPRFGSTTEILQQIQNQLQPPLPTRVNWPYYSESGLDNKSRNTNQNMANYHNIPDDMKARNFGPTYRPTSLQDENLYQNCATTQRCVYRTNVNSGTYSTVMRVGGCNEYYQSLPRSRSNSGSRPQSPPPLEVSKYQQTMVYIPYNHLEGYQSPNPYYASNSDYVRVTNQNQINKRYIEPIYQQRIHPQGVLPDYNPNMMPPVPQKPMMRMPYANGQPPPHMMTSRSESPLSGQFSTARSTQTPGASMSTCNYYQANPRYRPMIGPAFQGEGTYVTKMNRHSFPAGNPRYPPADSVSLTDSDSVHSGQMPTVLPNGYTSRQTDINFPAQKDALQNSPTKPRFIERGVPEGAASISPQDSTATQSSSTMTSPTSPQNPPQTNQKPMFYAMNV